MKRHPALSDLARDHFHALVCALNLRKASTPEETERAALALVRLWNDDLIYHFREEEDVLLPVLSRHGRPTDDPDIRQMLDDHAYLRDGLRRLERLMETKQEYGALAREMGVLLESHARLEDRVIFGRLEQCLSEPELEEVARLSRDHRERWDRPQGPEKAKNKKTSIKRGCAHYILFVADQLTSRDFYQAILDLEPRLDVPGMTEFEWNSGAVLGLMPRSSIKALVGVDGGQHSSELYLVIDNPEAVMERAAARGATILSAFGPRDWGAWVGYLQDLDGHILALADRSIEGEGGTS